jgi:uncharacterized membrane protein YeaQ/YmgE (transglycosylase-associated protein family)
MSTEIIVALITGIFGSIVTPLIANFLNKDNKSSGFRKQTIFFSVLGMIVGMIIATSYFAVRGLGTIPSVTPTARPDILARVVRTDSEIHIDGSLDEPAWSEGMSFAYATHPEKNGSSMATVRFLWDADYLYVAFDISDTQVETADLSSLWDGDSVSLLLHDGGIAEYRQSLGAEQNEDRAYQLKPLTTLNEPADADAGYTVEMRIEWKETPVPGKRIPADLLSVDHDANPGAKYDAPATIFSKLSWDGDGDITSPGVNLLLVDGSR